MSSLLWNNALKYWYPCSELTNSNPQIFNFLEHIWKLDKADFVAEQKQYSWHDITSKHIKHIPKQMRLYPAISNSRHFDNHQIPCATPTITVTNSHLSQVLQPIYETAIKNAQCKDKYIYVLKPIIIPKS